MRVLPPVSMKIQYGCGLCAPNDWENYDSSPTITLQRLPLIGSYFKKRGPRFPDNIIVGNIAKGLDVSDSSADAVYCSHVLEHLSLEEFRFALRETRRMLRKDGIFRFVVPDLEAAVREYSESSLNDKASNFLRSTLLGREKRERSFFGFLRQWIGGSAHLWMWDFDGISVELEEAGFTDIRRAFYNDSEHKYFENIEDQGRWDGCLGIECRN